MKGYIHNGEDCAARSSGTAPSGQAVAGATLHRRGVI